MIHEFLAPWIPWILGLAFAIYLIKTTRLVLIARYTRGQPAGQRAKDLRIPSFEYFHQGLESALTNQVAMYETLKKAGNEPDNLHALEKQIKFLRFLESSLSNFRWIIEPFWPQIGGLVVDFIQGVRRTVKGGLI